LVEFRTTIIGEIKMINMQPFTHWATWSASAL